MTSHFLASSAEVGALPLSGAALTQIRISAACVDLIFTLEDASTAEIRVESRVTVTTDSLPALLVAGPELGRALLSLLDRTVHRVEGRGLDLMIAFGGGDAVVIHVDESGFESYSVVLSGETWIAHGLVVGVRIRPKTPGNHAGLLHKHVKMSPIRAADPFVQQTLAQSVRHFGPTRSLSST